MTSPAGQAGVNAARQLRRRLGIDDAATLPGVADVMEQTGLGRIAFEENNHQPPGSVRAAVGWQSSGKAAILGPEPHSPESKRFMLARGLFHAAFLCQNGARLLTRAHDWDQQASRGFAAELLAPRAALAAEVPANLDDDERDDRIADLARKYEVHPELVRRQLQNASRQA